tara:strand:+ start:820 stop:1344 length:525 start_codon:yes stop_codon:yes gene_type:complete
MSLKKLYLLISILFISQEALAEIPVEVIDSCKKHKPVNASVAFKEMIPPSGQDDILNCTDYMEYTNGSFKYGAITCDDKNYLVLNSEKINLKAAVNNSINPSISPGEAISPVASWSKIIFKNNSYLCIRFPLSPSGQGASVLQYYIIENAFNASKPILHYYFFDKKIMPMTAVD